MNWGKILFGAGLAALALINEQTHWLPPLQFTALAIAILLIVVAPQPAWVALLIAGIAAHAASSAALMVDYGHRKDFCLNSIAICDDKLYTPGNTKFLLELPLLPAALIVAGVLGWAIRRRSWRTAVAGAVYGVAVETMPWDAPIVLLAAAAVALGPRGDARYVAGIGILALAWIDQQGPWTLMVTIVAITATLALVVWALVKKDGVNGAVALVALASASLTPFLCAGVLLAASLVQRRAWIGLTVAAAVIGIALYNQAPVSTGTQMAWLSQDQVPAQPIWLSGPALLAAATAMAAVAAMTIRRTAERSAGTPNR